jgi:glycosyltransferase involved in cell wall biosynthesis
MDPQTVAPALRPAPSLVSVVVPMLDSAETIGEQLDALAKQDYEGEWELIVADNGSRDGGPELARDRGVRVVDASTEGRGPNLARNAGARHANGDFLAFCDSDDVAAPDWLSALVEAGRTGDIVAGRLETRTLNEQAVLDWNENLSWDERHPAHLFLPFVSTSNCGIWTDVFEDLGGFREEIRQAEDKEISWRAQLNGHRLVVAPDAVVSYRYRASARASAWQHFRYGLALPALYRLYRNHGFPRTSVRKAVGVWAWIVVFLPAMLWSNRARGLWATQAGRRAGQLVGSIRHRVVFL